MAKSVNRVTLIGNVGRVEKMEGKQITSVSIATTDEGYTKKDGTRVEDKTYWHRCVAFGKLADIIAQYVQKGDRLYIEGRLTYNEYEKDNVKHTSTDIVIEEVSFMGNGRQAQQGNTQETRNEVKSDLPF